MGPRNGFLKRPGVHRLAVRVQWATAGPARLNAQKVTASSTKGSRGSCFVESSANSGRVEDTVDIVENACNRTTSRFSPRGRCLSRWSGLPPTGPCLMVFCRTSESPDPFSGEPSWPRRPSCSPFGVHLPGPIDHREQRVDLRLGARIQPLIPGIYLDRDVNRGGQWLQGLDKFPHNLGEVLNLRGLKNPLGTQPSSGGRRSRRRRVRGDD